MDEAEQDQSEARLKELFDSFDVTGTGSLGHEELTELCRVLHLEEVAPGALQQTFLQGDLLSRVRFDQFKEALILLLSRTLTNEESFQEPDSSPEAQPKYIKGGKRYGRRSMPEFQKSTEEFAEVTVIEPLNEEAHLSHISSDDCDERWRSQDSEEYEAEGQLRFWNPDDLNASQSISPTQDWIEEKLHEVCESLGISRDGHLNRKKLASICKQCGLQNVDMQVVEGVFRNLQHDSTMTIEDFFYRLFKTGKPLPPSASTPYRQLKRHLSMQSFDETGRRTTTPSAMTSTIGFRVFSRLDDGMGYAAVEQIFDAWHEEGIENSHEILKTLEFNLDGKINLAELTLALENELLITKNGIYQAVLASFKTEIRHLMEQADQEAREKEKLRLDLEKAEKLKVLMASEVDDHHAAIERQNEYNLSKVEEEYKERVAALKNELQKDREQIQLQANKQRAELEEEMEKLKTEENYLRDRLTLTLKNSRLENELLATGEKLVKYESTISKLQKNWENVLAEKFGDLNPGSAEFFLQEERLMQMKNEYERQCRELQDQIDELQSQLEEYQAQGRVARPSLKASLFEELDDGGVVSAQAAGSEDCKPVNMSIEAEMVIEQLKDQHHRDLCSLQEELGNTMCHYEKQLKEAEARCEMEQENLQRTHAQERRALEQQVGCLQAQVSELQGQLARLKQEWQEVDSQREVESSSLQACLEEKATLVGQLKLQHLRELQARLEEAQADFSHEREELIQAGVWMEEKMRALAQTVQEEKAELEDGFHNQLQRLIEKHSLDKEQLRQELAGKYWQELKEERTKMENEFNGRMSRTEEQFAIDRQALVSKYGGAIKGLEEHYQRELRKASELQREVKSQWEFEKDEIVQEGAEAQERWKEMLEKAKATSSALAQEKELLEKQFKEYVNSLVLEKEQLQKELQDAKKREGELRERLLQMRGIHEEELKGREDVSPVEEDQELLHQKLGSLEAKFAREKEELASRLVTLERLKQEALSRAAEENKELRAKVLMLEDKTEELQQELQCLSKLQRNLIFLSKEAARGGDSPELVESQEPSEVMDIFSYQEAVQEPPREGDVATVPVDSKLLKRPERKPTRSPSFIALVPELFVDTQLLNMTDEGNVQAKREGGIKESENLAVEIEGTIFEATMETSLALEKAYEEVWAENETLRLQQSRLQERISLLEAECDQATLDRQDMASQVEKDLEEILKTIPQPNALPCGSEESEERSHRGKVDNAKPPPDCATGNKATSDGTPEAELNAEKMADCPLQLEMDHRGASRAEKRELENLAAEPWGANTEKDMSSRAQCTVLPLPEELKVGNQALKAEMIRLFEQNTKLEGCLPRLLLSLQSRLEESDRESLTLTEEKLQLLERVKELEEVRDQFAMANAELQSSKLALQSRLGKMEVFVANLKAPKGARHGRSENGAKDAEVEARGLHELNRKLKDKVAALLKQKGSHAQENDGLNVALHALRSTCSKQQRELELMRCEADHLREENAVLRNKIALLNEEGSISNLRLRELNGSQEELWQEIEVVRKEKVAVQKMAENLKKQASELKARNQQLELENAELERKNSPNQADAQDLNQRLLRVLRQREKEVGKFMPEEWRREGSRHKEELENCKIQSSTLVSSLETELSQLRAQARALEEENRFLKEELEKVKQVPRCLDRSDLQNEISSVIAKNEKVLAEKAALSEELNRCVEKAAKVALLENLVASLKQEKSSLEHENQALKTQIAASQDKIRNFDDAVQNVNLQMSRLKSDLRVSQQETETLKQEVMLLHKQLQTANDKNRVLEAAVHSTGLQSQQKKLCWDELGHLAKQEQQLLRQDNERLQREVQSTKADLAHSREKIRQLESTILSLKHVKHQSQSGIVKAIEQEKLNLKRECERLQKELASANRKISQMNSLEHELETINLENEGLRKKQVKLDAQLLHSSPSMMCSPPQHPHELLQQQGCSVVPWEHYQQLQHQFLQAERRCQRLQEELESQPLETNMPQGGQEHLLKTMEKRMMDVEQQLRLVKRLLQDKVNQLKEQLAKNTRADEMVKDLYVENAQLLKALEMTEQRQRTVEKKNYLLEEKIANLGRIVKNLTSPTLGSVAQLGS
ncbi:ninein isoform X2 [Rhineura floridana]|uniref:ninein isoform X2 n=1 Tax=Rhineura floridana TaxID=261503 RepID=UPI002AC883B7|nr:ninein isoform X2 [Rhineura floridana]